MVNTTDPEFLEQPTLATTAKKPLPLFVESQPPLWVNPKVDKVLDQKISTEFHLHPVLSKILVNRDIADSESIHSYLYARLPDLYDPFIFADMPKAVKRIHAAIEKGETILVYGDNDVDGMTGVALLTEFLSYVGAKVLFHVSNRSALLRQSMMLDALEFALRNECSLMITVDCGITAAEQIAEAVRHNIDVIVTDHHEPTEKIPHCVATLNPKLLNCKYPNRDLTGVGVAFKLAHALTEYLMKEEEGLAKKIDLKRYLDLVAIGTVADMGALTGENRILVSYGLTQLRKGKRIGLAKLLSICEINIQDATTATIAFKIAPRLNSLGRIAEPEKGVKLLLIRNTLAAEKLAAELNLYNIERQKLERMMTKDVQRTLEDKRYLKGKAVVLASRKWHPGIIAILAMRLSKHFSRPCVMIALDGQVGKGSVRSIPEFPVLPVLKELSSLLINFGGHDAAAGLTIREQCIDEFTRRFVEIADQRLQDLHVTPKLLLDVEVPFDQITFDLMESLRLLEPYGHGNLAPIFYTECVQAQDPKLIGKHHLKLFLEQNERILEGIASGLGYQIAELKGWKGPLRVAYTPQVSGSSIHLTIRGFQKIEEV